MNILSLLLGVIRNIVLFVLLTIPFLSTADALAALAPLEIVAPRSGLSTANRYYKAYPGLLYEVPIAAIGGTYPNTYALTTGPSGMSINSSTGVLSWPNPTTTGSPHSVTVQVQDALGATASLTWTITVTITGFIFMDSSAPNGGTGSLAAPFNTIDDWYITKANAAYSGQFIYFRTGTYRTDVAPVEDGWRLAMPGHKPTVWLSYPGETPLIDVTGSHIAPYPSIANWYMEGLTVRNMTTDFGIRIDSGGNHMVFYRNTFDELPTGAGGVGTNASAIMISNGGSKTTYAAIINNTFSDLRGSGQYGILGYYVDKMLVQSNTFTNIVNGNSKAIGPKMNNQLWFIRDNRVEMADSGDAIWIDTYPTTGNIEVSYNLARSNGNALWAGQETGGYGAIESYRNTYVGDVVVDNLSGSGPVTFTTDVIVNSSANANHIDASGGSVSVSNILSGAAGTGLIDSNGNLQGVYTSYVGSRGYQRGMTDTTAPAAPTGLATE